MRLPGFTAGATLYASGRTYYMAGARATAGAQGVVASQDCPDPCPPLSSEMCPFPNCNCKPPGWDAMNATQQCTFAYKQCTGYHDPSDPTDCCHWWNSNCLPAGTGGGDGGRGGGEPHGPPFHHGLAVQ
jgi:hypothetical protein